jgi:PAS domain S-box-containing protein
MQTHSPSGLQAMPNLQWGSHLTQFFGSGDELRDLLVPYFKAGLENNESCLWVTGSAFNAEDARSALRAAVPDLDQRERNRQIEIANADEWYSVGQKLQPNSIVTGLLQREQDALAAGYTGLRTNGNCAWVSRDQWDDLQEYELLVHKAIRGRRMICMCSYCVDQFSDFSNLDVMKRHDFVLPSTIQIRPQKLNALTDSITSMLDALPAAIYLTDADGYLTYYNSTAAELWGYHPEIGKQRWCGTWKIFLFDGTRVPHDQCPMAAALQTGKAVRGIEANAERPDGTLVPCAVYPTPLLDDEGNVVGGINMLVDISYRKTQEQKYAGIAREMHHRVNNTLATVQAIMNSTLRQATTLDEFRENFSKRIAALSKTHAVLTKGAEGRVTLRDLLRAELDMFKDGDKGRVRLSGDDFALSERVVVPLGMAIHELATNAVKYGALSVMGGTLTVEWTLSNDTACLEWKEANVPITGQIKRVGFGTRLLKDILPEQIGAEIGITYESDGVRAFLAFPVD